MSSLPYFTIIRNEQKNLVIMTALRLIRIISSQKGSKIGTFVNFEHLILISWLGTFEFEDPCLIPVRYDH